MEKQPLSRRLKLAGLAVGLLLVPVSFSPQSGLQASQACADGTCCYEAGSICGLNGTNYTNYYYLSSGSCKETKN